MLSGGCLCVLGARAVGSAGWGSPVGWRGSVVVLEPSISEVGSSACTPLLSKHRALSPGQVGSHTNVEGVCHLLSTVFLLQYGELVLPSVQSCYDGAGTVVVVVLAVNCLSFHSQHILTVAWSLISGRKRKRPLFLVLLCRFVVGMVIYR